MASFEAKVDQATLEHARARLDPARFVKLARGALNETLQMFQAEVQQRTPVDRGLLRGSIFTQINGQGVSLVGTVAPNPSVSDYAAVMEEGRRPGAKMPPIDAILAWVQRKHLTGVYSVRTHRRLGNRAANNAEDRSVAFLIARAIGRNGIQGRHMFRDGFAAGENRVSAIFQRWFDKA